ncbi:MAG: efflux RND transporter permease subunit, partial [Candidatus Aminicenantaceae bacterium]
IAFALAGSLIFTLFVIPALSYYMIPVRIKAGSEPFLIRTARKIYLPVFQYCSRRRKPVFVVTGAVFLIGLALFPFLGREYIPSLEEGSLHVQVAFDPNISLQETINISSSMEKDLLNIPEINGVLTRIGRGEVGSHAHFVNEAQMLLDLKPPQQWKRFRNKNELYKAVEDTLMEYPGATLNLTQPIAHNLDELLTGVKAQLAVKIYGENFDILQEKSIQVKDVLAATRGAADVQVEQFTGQNHIQIIPDRSRLARYGLNLQEVQETIRAAIGGITLGQVYEEQKKFDIFLRFSPEFRNDIQKIEQLLIRLPGQGQIPLAQVADIKEVIGPRMITRENNKRFITVQCNIRGRDIGGFVDEAKKKMRASVVLPPEYFLKWGGQFELQQQANRRLALIMPVTLVLIVLLLFTIFYSFREVLIILINIPLALTGGIIALKLSGLYLSVPASIGFIAIFGIALEDGLVLLSTFHHRLKEGLAIEDAVLAGVRIKLRPVLMTTFTTVFGIMPLLLAAGSGAEIQRPLAVVVTGGLVTSTLVTLIVLPLIFQGLKKPAAG